MAQPIRFYFDFASPYAWFALPHVAKLAAAHGRALELRPILLWAILKEQKVTPPFESPARKAYLLADMERSAAYYERKLHLPMRIPFSAHLAARFFHGAQKIKPDCAVALAEDILAACFERGEDVTTLAALQAIGAQHGFSADDVAELASAAESRALLAACVDEAVAAGVVGSPFMILDGEGFFGADRVPQLAWRLEGR